MVQTEPPKKAGRQASTGQAASEAEATTEGQRIVTAVVIERTLDGIPFGRLKSNPDLYVSAPIFDPAVVTRLLTIPEFTLADDLSADDLAALNARHATIREEDETHVIGGVDDVPGLKRTIAELTNANLAMSAELAETRAERDELRRQASGSEVERLKQQIEALRRELDQGGGASIALQAENDRLQAALSTRPRVEEPTADTMG